MIYTVGLIEVYEPRIDAGTAVKGGRTSTYEGGWVWQTAAAAQAYLGARRSQGTRRVYGVLADWNADTEPAESRPYRYLLRDAVVVRLKR